MSSKNIKSHLFLLKLIENSYNKYCADCGSEGTRWASWNLGIFLCIRCAGIHRNLGVHISKVKSVDLDSWTPEQLQSMEKIGNKKSQEIYEATLPKGFIRPQTNYMIEEFIRAKYEYKKYVQKSETELSKENEETTISDPSLLQVENEKKSKKTKKQKSKTNSNINYEIGDDNNNSDDSLSEPEYLQVTNKNISKSTSYHKVHSDGDLINLNCNITAGNKSCINASNKNNKETIMSLYQAPSPLAQSTNPYHYSNSETSSQSYHRGYGSATYSQDHFTNSIPASSQSSYLKMIQDKLGSFKDQIQNRFSSYEQPGASSSITSSHSFTARNGNNYQPTTYSTTTSKQQHNTSSSGQTLSPDLWK